MVYLQCQHVRDTRLHNYIFSTIMMIYDQIWSRGMYKMKWLKTHCIKGTFGNLEMQFLNICSFFSTGSIEERNIVERASKFSHRFNHKAFRELYSKDHGDDIVFTFDGAINDNGDVSVALIIENTAHCKVHTVETKMYAHAQYYTGLVGEEMAQTEEIVTIEEGKGM